jgi:hypothetical protein
MSNSKNGRISRGKPRRTYYAKGKHRQALPDLLRDFDGRCAYSMRKEGVRLEVDHFNSKLTGRRRNHHANLFPATRHCNRIKWDVWPSAKDRKHGLRFLNCCEEIDYGEHIFEDPVTHRVFGVTPAGRYHVRHCDLNDGIYVQERRQRAQIRKLLHDTAVVVKNEAQCMALYRKLCEVRETMIPDIPLRREGELPLEEVES